MSDEPKGRKVMVIIPHYWGKADDLKGAIANVKKESGSRAYYDAKKRGLTKILSVSEDAYVNEMGSVFSNMEMPVIELGEVP